MMKLNSKTRLFLSASANPSGFGVTVYNALFEEMKIDAVYLPRKITDAAALVGALRALSVAGCSVSMPLKAQVIPYLDELEPLAREVQSVNTIVAREGRLVGYNTDCVGFERALGKGSIGRALIYGAGSVTDSIVAVLKSRGAREISIAARRPDQAEQAARNHGLSRWSGGDGRWDWVINATPGSREPRNEANGELYRLIEVADHAFDLVIAPKQTPWIAAAAAAGVSTVSGVEMGIHQLQKQFEHYVGVAPQLEAIRRIVQGYLATQAA